MDSDSLLRLVSRLAEAGHSVRRIRVGDVEVELDNRPVRVASVEQDGQRLAKSYAQRALDRREQELERLGAIQKPRS